MSNAPEASSRRQTAEITTLTSRLAYQNPWLTVREDTVRRADGSDGLYGVVERPDFVVLAAIAGDCIAMVEQYRYPVRRRVWELPMGGCEPGATPLQTAATELREETGLVANQLAFVASILMGPGFCNQIGHIFLATGLQAGPAQREATEQGMICRNMPIAELERMIASGELQDAATLAALAALRFRCLL